MNVRKAVCALAVAALAAMASSTAVTAETLASHGCAFSIASDGTSVQAMEGRCLDGNKRLPARWTYSYRFFDDRGNVCGTATVGHNPGFSVPTGASTASYAITLKSKVRVKGRYLKRTIRGRLSLGGNDYECGRLGQVELPAQAAACPWNVPMSPSDASKFNNCGVPNDFVSFDTEVGMAGNIISAGQLATRLGVCRDTEGPVPPDWPAAPRADWLGLPQQGTNVVCGDTIMRVNLSYIAAVNQSGQKCEGGPPVSGLRSFQIPDFGGTFYVLFTIGVRTGGKFYYESQSQVFHLNGSVDPCQYMVPIS